jgi:glutathione synthase/RimK-type ligase-like ATP-grasp enzyme
MVYDRSETDELGIRQIAKENGINIGYLPFHKIAVAFGSSGFKYYSLGKNYVNDIAESKVIINRTQSKSRRIFASNVFEALDKKVLNSLNVELSCQSKLRTLLLFFKNGIGIPRTVYVPCNTFEERDDGGSVDNIELISEMISIGLGEKKIVLKPDAGSHGRDVKLVKDAESMNNFLKLLTPSITNPSGVLAQEFIPKWFYDLRIIVEKRKGASGFCHSTALARGGIKEFRTNTFLGNMVFRVNLPQIVIREAVRCGEALAGDSKAWVIALDAMPYIGEDVSVNDEELKSYFEKLEKPFEEVRRIKRNPNKKRDFLNYSKAVERAYESYMSTEAYLQIERIIQESLKKNASSILFHEGNSCPEFWEQTRIVGGINVAESLINSAISILDN